MFPCTPLRTMKKQLANRLRWSVSSYSLFRKTEDANKIDSVAM